MCSRQAPMEMREHRNMRSNPVSSAVERMRMSQKKLPREQQSLGGSNSAVSSIRFPVEILQAKGSVYVSESQVLFPSIYVFNVLLRCCIDRVYRIKRVWKKFSFSQISSVSTAPSLAFLCQKSSLPGPPCHPNHREAAWG